MSPIQRHIKSQHNITYEEPYAIIQKPTDASFISKETMEINEETESVRQESEVVYDESKLAENKETKGQTQKEGVT
tara:strand:- start:877 stop:1104 length:228 start_codon:yes stop_codon:yes gene_type:complete